jgi:hypothetical protein
VVCTIDRSKPVFCHNDVHVHLLVIFLVIESLLFGLFTMCMIGDQWTTISSNQTQIDRIKGTKHEYQNEFNEVCGSLSTVSFSWSWFLPTPVTFNEDVKPKILGYRIEENEERSPLMRGSGSSSTDNGHAGNGEGLETKLMVESKRGKSVNGRKSPRQVSFCFF